MVFKKRRNKTNEIVEVKEELELEKIDRKLSINKFINEKRNS